MFENMPGEVPREAVRKNRLRFTMRRLLVALITLIGVSLLAFALFAPRM